MPPGSPGDPGYYVTELVGLNYGGGPNAWAGTLLSNGTVVGGTEWAGGGELAPPTYSLCTWTSSGAFTNVYTVTHPIEYVWGRQRRANRRPSTGLALRLERDHVHGDRQLNLNYPTYPGYVSSGGLVCGYNAAVTESWA